MCLILSINLDIRKMQLSLPIPWLKVLKKIMGWGGSKIRVSRIFQKLIPSLMFVESECKMMCFPVASSPSGLNAAPTYLVANSGTNRLPGGGRTGPILEGTSSRPTGFGATVTVTPPRFTPTAANTGPVLSKKTGIYLERILIMNMYICS